MLVEKSKKGGVKFVKKTATKKLKRRCDLKNKTIAKQNEIAKKNLEDESFENDEYIDITCPTCGEDLSYHKFEFTNNDELICPKCSNPIQTED